jgi:hypothetical protein
MKKKRKKVRPQTRPQPDLNQVGRAQLGPDEEKRPYRPRKEDASVEDPLEDWPEEPAAEGNG